MLFRNKSCIFATDNILSLSNHFNRYDNILSVLENFSLDNADDIAINIANDFRKRRIEKNLTREQVAERSNVPLSNIARFEQKGLISLKNQE